MRTMTDTAKATILLCSYLALTDKQYRPYSPLEWYKLGKIIFNSEIKTPDKLFGLTAKEIQEKLQLNEREAKRIVGLLSRGGVLSLALEELDKLSIYVITKSDYDYPKRLSEILPANRIPPVLFACGNANLANNDGIAVVGSRHIDYEGETMTSQLVKDAVAHQLSIYSGGAKGIDQVAIQTALSAGGYAIAVLADSMSREIRRKNVREAISTGKLLLLSAVLPASGFNVGNAMARNKYVYALSKVAVVIASDKNRGGTWAGAVEALQEQYVPVYVWNTENYEGNMTLIQKGAHAFKDCIDWQTALCEKNQTKRTVEMSSLFASVPEIQYKNGQSKIATVSENNTNDTDTYLYDSVQRTEVTSQGIFQVVWPLLRQILQHANQEQEILQQLGNGVVKKQLHIWLQDAVANGLVKKKSHPVRYELL